jgi:hypothetical protein
MKFFALTFILLVLVHPFAVRGAMISLTSTSPDLTALPLDQPVHFSVDLSELPIGGELDSLYATVKFDGNLFDVSSATPGAIVPDPLSDPLDFQTTADLGLVDAAFLTFDTASASHIVASGRFIDFTLTPAAVGTGSIWFDFVGATQFNSSNPAEPIPLELQVSGPLILTIVPEPLTNLVLVLGASLCIPMFRRRTQHR